VAQLHLAFPSPVPAVEGKNEGKFANQLGKLNYLTVLIGKLVIGESLSDGLIHCPNLSEKIATLNPMRQSKDDLDVALLSLSKFSSDIIYRIKDRRSMRAP